MLFLTLLAAQICRRLEYMLRERGCLRTAGGREGGEDLPRLCDAVRRYLPRCPRIAGFVSGYCISDAVVMCMNQPKFTRRDQDGAD